MNTELPRIIVGIDFSPSSERAIGEARRLAREMGAQLDLVHVYPLTASPPAITGMAIDPTTIEAARKLLANLEHELRAQGFAATTHLGVGCPAFGLLDFTKRLKPVLVVVGSHGRGAVMRLVLGSVAESLIRRSPVPVLVVPPCSRVVDSAEESPDAARSVAMMGH